MAAAMDEFIHHARHYFLKAGLFSLFINVLLLTVPLYMLQVFDRVLTSRSEETLVMLTLAALFLLLVMLLLDVVRGRILLGAGIALDNLLGPVVVERLLAAGADPGGRLAQQAAGLRDVALVRGFLGGNGVVAIFDAPWVPLYIAVIFLFHPLLGWAAVAGALVLFATAWLNERLTRDTLERMGARTRVASRFIDMCVRNAEVISALGMRAAATLRWQRVNDGVIDAQLEAGVRGATFSGVSKFVRLAVQVMILALGAWLVVHEHISAGVMMAATLILARALAPVESAISTWRGLVEARDAWHRLQRLTATGGRPHAGVEIPLVEGRLDVERLSFGVPGTDRMTLKGIQFAIAPGEALAIIGPSAAGKSTLLRLLAGVWRPTVGVVRFSGADVSDWPREQLGPLIGYLPQDVELFAGTVAENIARLGEVDSDRVVAAAQRAQAHELILKLPRGYETEIGDGGAVLSGGQRQRLGLARALYGDPRLILLDEPNASLDAAGEEALSQVLRELKTSGVTVVVVSHKPSLLASVDKMLVLREGQVDSFGPRAEVMARFAPRAPQPAAPNAAATGGFPVLMGQRTEK